MTEVLNQLQEEHRTAARLLNVLEQQLAVFDAAGRPDYEILSAIAEYFNGFPDRCHHPKEDLIYRKLRERDPAAAEVVGDLEAEHERISELAQRFREAVRSVMGEAEMPRSAFDAVLRQFIAEQRRHMEMEGERFFARALSRLSDEDWAEIEAEVSGEQEPLFGPAPAEEYEKLRDDILRWEAEEEAAAT